MRIRLDNGSSRVQDEYFKYLINKVRVNVRGDDPNLSFYNLMRALHKKEFYWTVDYDDNREGDGVYGRELFIDEKGYISEEDEKELDGPCTVLEMMVNLSIRMEKEYMSEVGKGDRTYLWFWGMIKSLGLDGYDDAHFDRYDVDVKLDSMLERRYSNDGVGSLFTLPKKVENYNKLEIWDQMNAYLNQTLI